MAREVKAKKQLPRAKRLVATDPRNPAPSSEAVRRSMQGNKGKDTGPELLLRKALWAAGVRGYRLHRRIEGVRPDLVFGKAKVAVFVHGCFWHRCPYCKSPLPRRNRGFWKAKFNANQARDRRKRRVLEAVDWRVFELWECRLVRSPENAARLIGRFVPVSDRPA
jgi:DNA mismatch endonuclease (patch repair protein)